MTDITKCSGIGCAVRNTCWRYRAKRSDVQSWCAFYATESFQSVTGCDYFFPVPPDDPNNGPRPPGALAEGGTSREAA